MREYFPPREAGVRTGIVLMATLFGMALGGWISGAIFDLTGSYRAAFLNGIAWNLLNLTIAFWLLASRPSKPRARARLTRRKKILSVGHSDKSQCAADRAQRECRSVPATAGTMSHMLCGRVRLQGIG